MGVGVDGGGADCLLNIIDRNFTPTNPDNKNPHENPSNQKKKIWPFTYSRAFRYDKDQQQKSRLLNLILLRLSLAGLSHRRILMWARVRRTKSLSVCATRRRHRVDAWSRQTNLKKNPVLDSTDSTPAPSFSSLPPSFPPLLSPPIERMEMPRRWRERERERVG